MLICVDYSFLVVCVCLVTWHIYPSDHKTRDTWDLRIHYCTNLAHLCTQSRRVAITYMLLSFVSFQFSSTWQVLIRNLISTSELSFSRVGHCNRTAQVGFHFLLPHRIILNQQTSLNFNKKLNLQKKEGSVSISVFWWNCFYFCF
jgi:hypothetical protein